jgi:hypothetical protein
MKYVIKMGSYVMIYIPRFIKIGFSHSKVDREDTERYGHHGDGINLLPFVQNKESRLK